MLKITHLGNGHWRWAAFGILGIMGLFMLGMLFNFAGIYHPGILLLTILFFFGLPLLSGLGVRLGLDILKVLPGKYSWLYFGGVFFVLFMFGFPTKAMIVLVAGLLFSGAFLGAGIYNLTGNRWSGLDRSRRILTLVFISLGGIIFLTGTWFIRYPGKAPEEVKVWAMESSALPPVLEAEDPSLPGPFSVDSLTYGWGGDRRPEFGEEVSIVTPVVDGSSFLDGWDKLPGKLRTIYWKMGPDSLALNGRVWYPVGEGPFPLVLMVHGNHAARDYSDPGYDYLGRHFASLGMISVSVDENFLNGDWSDFSKGLKTENDCRAWLLLKHLEQWRLWNRTDTSTFFNRVDMDQIILIGHSRGGEAVSIASCFNRLPFYPDNADEVFDFHFGIRGIAAIAPVDGQYWPAGIETPVQDVNYFTIHGSMDGDLRSFIGIRQMRRVRFENQGYHFASGLYVHGANHGQFNRSWGIYDTGYPGHLMLNRKAIIPVDQQEKVALVYLSAFIKESLDPGSGYLPLFKDARAGRVWLPGLVYMNQFEESSATIVCGYEEDLDLTTGTRGAAKIAGNDLSTWKEDRIRTKWDHLRNNGVYLGWNNEEDSVPGTYLVEMDSTLSAGIADARHLTFLAGDTRADPGERKKEKGEESDKGQPQELSRQAKNGEKRDKGKGTSEEVTEPVDFMIRLVDVDGIEHATRLGDHLKLQPPVKPQVYKSRIFWDDPESEVMMQYVSIPLEAFGIPPEKIRSIQFVFDQEGKGMVVMDQLGFGR